MTIAKSLLELSFRDAMGLGARLRLVMYSCCDLQSEYDQKNNSAISAQFGFEIVIHR